MVQISSEPEPAREPLSSSDNNNPTYLDPSPLGTKEYWSTLYSTDLETRQNTIPSHIGTSWFDDAGAEEKTVRYLNGFTKIRSGLGDDSRLSFQRTSFLDLGTGNGALLIALRKAGWQGKMVGVDYATQSVQLANGIWKDIVEKGWEKGSDDEDSDGAEGEDHSSASTEAIDFRVLDIIPFSDSQTGLPEWIPKEGFDVVLDKGTFDAVSLSADIDPATGRRIVEFYAAAAKRFLRKPNGRMVVTSCNWTESELERWFCGDISSTSESQRDQLTVIDKVPYRKFQFGGRVGSVVVGLVFGWPSAIKSR